MALSESHLREILMQHGVSTESLKPLWEIESAQIYGMTVAGSQAMQLWHTLRQLTHQTHHYPVLLGDDESVARHQENIEEVSPVILAQGLALDTDDWLQMESQSRKDDWDSYDQTDNDLVLDELTKAEVGEWSAKIGPSHTFIIPYNILTHEPLPEVTLALVPTLYSWEVPAYLNFGGWNACPQPDIHVALMKRWYWQYKAEVVGITGDVVEMWVGDPPSDRAAAFKLAQEQYLYCDDIVGQGVNTLNNLAATLLNASAWYFWWD